MAAHYSLSANHLADSCLVAKSARAESRQMIVCVMHTNKDTGYVMPHDAHTISLAQ